jgi:hypothetical protein
MDALKTPSPHETARTVNLNRRAGTPSKPMSVTVQIVSNMEVAMFAKLSISVGVIIAGILVIVSLWAWQIAPALALTQDRPDIILLWAVRAASIAAAALAQTVLLVFVVGNIYRTRAVDLLLRLMAGTVLAVSLVSAIALGLVGHQQ